MTDDLTLPASKVVQMYAYRWPIEVLFRHIKSSLGVIHLPSHDRVGVMNWILLVFLSVVLIQLLECESSHSEDTDSLMYRKTSFKEIFRLVRNILDQWILELAKIPGG